MKKFLLIAGFAVAFTGTSFAHGTGNNHNYEPPTNGSNDCEACGDESATSDKITICAGVRVPLVIDMVDNSIEFPCLSRPVGTYLVAPTSTYPDHSTIDPKTDGVNSAEIKVWGDEEDLVMLSLVNSVSTGKVRLFHQEPAGPPLDAQYSDGGHNGVSGAGETEDNPDWMDVQLSIYVSAINDESNPTNNNPTSTQTWNATAMGPYVLGNDYPGVGSNTLRGTGGLDVRIGGSVATLAGQQRGQYTGWFKVRADYAQ